MLQIAGIGRDPDRAAILLRPDAGRGDIAQRLADAGAGLGQHQGGRILLLARGKGGADGGGVIGLAGPRLRFPAQQFRQPGARLGGIDREMAGAGRRRILRPFRQVAPDIHADRAHRTGMDRHRLAQRRQHIGRPAPAAGMHGTRDRPGVAVILDAAGTACRIGEIGQQPLRHLQQPGRLVGEADRCRQFQRRDQPARCGQAEARRMHEGEQLQQIIGGEALLAQPLRRGPAMAQDRRFQHDAGGSIGKAQRLDLAISIDPDGFGAAGDQHRRPGQKKGGGVIHRRDYSQRPAGRRTVNAAPSGKSAGTGTASCRPASSDRRRVALRHIRRRNPRAPPRR